jgi:hypothetical protein
VSGSTPIEKGDIREAGGLFVMAKVLVTNRFPEPVNLRVRLVLRTQDGGTPHFNVYEGTNPELSHSGKRLPSLLHLDAKHSEEGYYGFLVESFIVEDVGSFEGIGTRGELRIEELQRRIDFRVPLSPL